MTDLHRDHIDHVKACYRQAMADHGVDRLLIAAGSPGVTFMDDRHEPFIPNPHFLYFVPLMTHAGSWLELTADRCRLHLYEPADYWHLPPATPTGSWLAAFDVVEHAARISFDISSNTAIIGEVPSNQLPADTTRNPKALVDQVHYHRATKTPYEIDCMAAANRRAVQGHRAAADAFAAGLSEWQTHLAYNAAVEQDATDLPYHSIIGLNEHAGVLHYQVYDRAVPSTHRSLLVDAGARTDGYGADITRTQSNGDSLFSQLIAEVDALQQRLVAESRAGVDYRALHLACHRYIGDALNALEIIHCDGAQALDLGITRAFFPHGLGHLIGLQVHDVGGFQAGPDGGTIDQPEGHPFLRLTRRLAPGFIVTIEPGVYFVDALLQPLKASATGKLINWTAVEHLMPFGGVRIEDDVLVTQDGAARNLSREAFAI